MTVKEKINKKALLALVVDDEKISQLVIKYALEELGYIVSIANNGYEAIKLSTQHYDLITMDFNMPQMNGVEATQTLRLKEKEVGKTPAQIIGMTAHIDQPTIDICLQAGMNIVLTKSIDMDDFKKTIIQLTEK
jgi:CheY-like chemotaxis protein